MRTATRHELPRTRVIRAFLACTAHLLLAVGASAQVAVRSAAPTRSTSTKADAAEIRATRERSNAAIARHDTAGIGASLASHVVLVTSNSVTSVGRQVVLDRFAEQFTARPDVTYRRTPRDVRVFAPWGMAAESGTWAGSWTDHDGKVAVGGSYFAKWRRIDGRWLLESETFVPEYCRGGTYCEKVP
ncbi:MAG: nuclear transport factor 2 family protein [Gemmatimonadaceae bacterium]